MKDAEFVLPKGFSQHKTCQERGLLPGSRELRLLLTLQKHLGDLHQ